jgi:hypothetical protein
LEEAEAVVAQTRRELLVQVAVAAAVYDKEQQLL